MKADKIKSDIKKLLVQIDAEKTGKVKLEAFAQILTLHKVILSKTSL